MNISEKIKSAFNQKTDILKNYDYALISIAGNIPEEKIPSPIPFIKADKQLTLWEIVHALAYIEKSGLDGLVLTIKPVNTGYSRANSIRNAICSLKNSGKKVYVYLDNPGNIEYFIASAADHISMSPMSPLNFTGISSELFFLRELLDNYGIEPEIFGIGEYKSAAETFNRNSMTEHNREMTNDILDEQFGRIINEISKSREIKKETLIQYLDIAPFSSSDAFKHGLIDNIGYEEDIKALIEDGEKKRVSYITIDKLQKIMNYSKKLHGIISRFRGDNFNVALVTISGMITQGKSRNGSSGLKTAGSDTITKTLEKVRNDKTVKAAIIRILSPGGSATASDTIRKNIEILALDKPVYISMSDVAASGGYMLSLSAEKIFCDPFTLTGSIGVVAGKINIKKLLSTLGIHSEIITRGKMSSIYSVTKAFTEDEKIQFRKLLHTMYDDFVNLVSLSRKMPREDVEKSARGRVWTGSRAEDLGLIDEQGDLMDTVRYAFAELGMTDQLEKRIKVYSHENRISIENLGKYIGITGYDVFDFIRDGEYIYCVMPFWLRIR